MDPSECSTTSFVLVDRLPSLVAASTVRHAIMLGPDDSPCASLGNEQTTAGVEGLSVAVLARMFEGADGAGRPVPAYCPVAGDVVEE